MVVVEMARVDASLSTFVMVHASLAMLTIEMLVCASTDLFLPRIFQRDFLFFRNAFHPVLGHLSNIFPCNNQGSEEQQKELLPAMGRLELVGCWALTEPSNGSDASALTTTAARAHRMGVSGWILNGQKRWIGNGTFADITVVWAKNLETDQVIISTLIVQLLPQLCGFGLVVLRVYFQRVFSSHATVLLQTHHKFYSFCLCSR